MQNHYHYSNIRNSTVVAFARGDVNGDKIPDSVYITGMKESDVSIIKNLTLVIQDGATGSLTQVPLNENIGYNPTLFLGDFTGDGVRDILITIATGGSGGTTYNYVYTFVHNNLRLLFDSDVYNQMYQYGVTYKDDYKVEVFSSLNNTKYLIDLTLREPEYLNEIYDTNGKLKSAVNGWVDPISGLYPIDFDSNKIYELLAYQKISGRYHADSLGFIQNRLKWNGSRFVLDYQDLAIFGSRAE
ncbi:VCBS repeat-containing protein [Mesobacillus selenatarsenatis]|uniref:VCBS repeat-containing protein n=1 Tax=Mesobacillus selenatarsenatis TaxID=388741 RepID=A0A846U2W0_9BACI|nr:VCBS repeat-containing protein [Mesobacillus selenatarsenatis]NKE08116.1 VCBS repeat-containing protein [Mesobacillus selenatarsenatis]